MQSPRRIDLDLETYSECDLRQSGVFPYARHPSTDVLCAAWYDTKTEKKRLWVPGKPPPKDLFAIMLLGVKVHAHNCQFDAELWRWVLSKKYGWWWPGYDAFMCTQAIGQIYNLPGKLDLAAQFVTGVGKDQAGYQLMLKLCKPARETKASSDPKRMHTPDRLKRLTMYCLEDVRAETSFISQIPYITPTEEKVWRRTYEMNLRGVQVDYVLVERLLVIAEACQDHYRSLLYRETAGAVEKETERAKLGRWLQLHGAKLPLTDKGNPSFSKDNEHLVDMDAAQLCAHEAFKLYHLLNNSSLSKLMKLKSCRCEDGRVRGMTRYSGAGQTGRWAGQDVQLQNLPRGLFETEAEYVQALEIVESGTTWDELELLYGGNALDVLSSLIRCCLVAKPGHKLIVADYAAVEGRVLAWLAGEKHVLDAYRDGKRLYAVAAAGIFGCSYEQVMKEKDAGNSKKDKVGKTSELACGYGGSVGAFLQFGGHKLGLTEERMKEIVYAWRDSRPKTVQLWRDYGQAAIRALENPRTAIRVGRVVFGYDGKDLRIKLPSGRFLYLHQPRLTEKIWPDGGTTPQITYYGVDGQKAGWLTIYDGKFAGIVTQATARDLLAHATLNVCDAGYKPVVTVHDELVCEEPEDGRTHEDLCALMSKLPDWAEGLPLNAEGFTTYRYRKG